MYGVMAAYLDRCSEWWGEEERTLTWTDVRSGGGGSYLDKSREVLGRGSYLDRCKEW